MGWKSLTINSKNPKINKLNTWLIQCVVESNQPFLAPSLAQITQFTLFFKILKQDYKIGFYFNLWLGSLLMMIQSWRCWWEVSASTCVRESLAELSMCVVLSMITSFPPSWTSATPWSKRTAAVLMKDRRFGPLMSPEFLGSF